MLTLSLLLFVKFYIAGVIILFLLLSLFNAITRDGPNAFKLVKFERIFIFVWPVFQFFIRILFSGFLGFIVGIVIFLIVFEYLRKKFPD